MPTGTDKSYTLIVNTLMYMRLMLTEISKSYKVIALVNLILTEIDKSYNVTLNAGNFKSYILW